MQGTDDGATPQAPHFADIAQALVAHVYGVDVKDLRSPKRSSPRAALARQIAMYLSHIVLRMTLTEIGTAFGRNRSTACHALHHVEDMRDDPELDRTLLELEVLLRNTAREVA
ncbi:MAG TPA: helix-turn-helix domain-containing protein [Rhizomicrobium sp.]|jgi:chromosomal replication initiation ATPase DnaA|nr:helix-turn-helix domain-containing protein [Rhizomicrobium sp.]